MADNRRKDWTDTEFVKASLDRSRRLIRDSNYRKVYGITLEDYERLLARQGGTCAICHSTGRKAKARWNEHYLDVDHDHETGQVRGLLCRRCNILLGYYEKYRHLLNSLKQYLQREAT